MPSKIQMPDLESFRIVAPTDRAADVVKESKLPDGTPMVGPDGLLVPAARTFASIVNSGTKVYSFRFDEAMRDNFVAARAMKRDAFLLGLFEERVLPTVNREFTLEVDDDRDPEQAYVRDALLRIVRGTEGFDALKRALLEAVWFGRSGVQWSWKRREKLDDRWGLGKWDPIHGDSVQFSFDGYPCILMDTATVSWYAANGATYGPPGVGDLVPTDRGGTALQLHRPYWRERFAIHQHLMQKADYFEGELAGSVQGLGLRGMVYWQYVVRTDALTWMLAYMQAVGQMDLLVFNYPAGNPAAEQRAILNAQKVIGKAAIACPRNPQGTWPAVEQISMNSAGLAALQTLVADYFDRHIERLFVGQSMSSGADKGNGLGGTGRADFARACVPVEGSEILTRDGFKTPETVQAGEEVLAYDPETDTCKWTPLLKKSFYEDAPVDRLFTEQNKFEAFCTPDHSWAVENTKYACDFRYEIDASELVDGPRGAKRLAKQDRYLRKAFDINTRENIILAAPEVETEDSLLTPTEAAILGWVVTDGTVRRYDGKFTGTRYSVGICQSKEEHFPEIRRLMVKYTGAEHETVVETNSRTFPMTGKTCVTKPQHWWYLPREHGTRLLKKAGFWSRSDLPKIVTRLSGAARRAMIGAMLRGDGHDGPSGTFFYNTDPHIVAAFDILCALEGLSTGARRNAKIDSRYKKCFIKTVKTGRHAYGLHLQRESVPNQDVWCPTTKYGTWVMRQNGRVMITGNTKDEILQFDGNRLDATLTRDFIAPLQRYNFPWAKFQVRFKSIFPDLKAAEKVQAGALMVQLGIPIKADELRRAADFSRPEPGDDIVGAPSSPMGAGAPPGPGGGGGKPPVWMGAPGGPPAMLSRGTNPTRYIGTSPAMGFPGGSNTYVPKRDNAPAVGFTRYADTDRDGWLVQDPANPVQLPVLGRDGSYVILRPRLDPLTSAWTWASDNRRNPFYAKDFPLLGIKGWADVTDAHREESHLGRPLNETERTVAGIDPLPETDPREVGDAFGYSRRTPPVNYGPPYKYCSTQVGLVGEAQMRVLQASSGIPPDALTDKGRELDAHVTILYGIESDDPEAVARAAAGFGKIRLTIGRASLFENEDADVLKFDVESDDLHRLRRRLTAKLPHTDTRREYKPHATSAYVKPGRGWEFVSGINPVNVTLEVDGFFFTDRDGRKTWISTTGEPPRNVWETSRNADSAQPVGYGLTPGERNALRDKRTAAQRRFKQKRSTEDAAALAARILERVRAVGPTTQSNLAKALNMDSATFGRGSAHGLESGTLQVRERSAHPNGAGRKTFEWSAREEAPTQNARDPQRYWLQAPPGGAHLNGRPYRSGMFVPGTTMFTHGGIARPNINPESPVPYQPVAGLQGAPQTLGGDLMAPAQPQQGPQEAPQPQQGAPTAPAPVQGPQAPTGPHDRMPGAPPPGPVLTRTPGLSPEDQTVEAQSQLFALQNYGPVRDLYFQTHAVTDPVSGDVRSLTIDTGAWKEFLPGYTGMNGPAVAAAARSLSDRLFKEALRNQAGKGNNTMMVLSGGAGAGDTAVGDYIETAEYPLVLDKVGTDYGALSRQFVEARAAGMEPEFLYVDRAAEGALEGAVEDALEKRLAGQPPQTDTLRRIAEDNIKARRTALEVLFRNPEVRAAVVDEDGGARFQRRLITDRWEAAQYLSARIAEDEAALQGGALERLKQNIVARHKRGEVPADVVTSLLGENWNVRPPVPLTAPTRPSVR